MKGGAGEPLAGLFCFTYVLSMATTYFFERKDGTAFAVDQKGAFEQTRRFKFIGSSNGNTYMMKLQELKAGLTIKKTKVQALENKLNALQEKLTMEDDDKKLELIQAKNQATLKLWEDARQELAVAAGEIDAKAFAAELEVAKANVLNGTSRPPDDTSIEVFGAKDPGAVKRYIMGM